MGTQRQPSRSSHPNRLAIISSRFNSKTPGLIRVCPGRPGHGSTRWVDWVLPGHCTGWSFDKPEPVQPPGQPVSGLTRRSSPGLITMFICNNNNNFLEICANYIYKYWIIKLCDDVTYWNNKLMKLLVVQKTFKLYIGSNLFIVIKLQ